MINRPLKIAVLNLSGNVGKTTMTTHLLSSYRTDAKIVSVETQNNSDALKLKDRDVEEIPAQRFDRLLRVLMESDDLLVDVGSSNILRFMDELSRHRSAIEEFDLFVIPTVPAEKQQKDTTRTISWLHEIGVRPEKIRVVFNQQTDHESLEYIYPHVLGYAATDGKSKATWSTPPVVMVNEVYGMLMKSGRTIKDTALDSTDYRAKRQAARAANDTAGFDAAFDAQVTRDLALHAHKNLEQAHVDLFAPLALVRA